MVTEAAPGDSTISQHSALICNSTAEAGGLCAVQPNADLALPRALFRTTEQRIDLVCDYGAHGGILQTHAHHLPQAELELDIATVLVSTSDAKVDGFTCGWHVESELQVHLHTQAAHAVAICQTPVITCQPSSAM